MIKNGYKYRMDMCSISIICSNYSRSLCADWYEFLSKKKGQKKIRETLGKDVTELQMAYYVIGKNWNNWVYCIKYEEITKNTNDFIEIHKENLQDSFIDFRVKLDMLYLKLKIHLNLPEIDLKSDYSDPILVAMTKITPMAEKMQESIDSYELEDEKHDMRDEFMELSFILSSLYPMVLKSKIKRK